MIDSTNHYKYNFVSIFSVYVVADSRPAAAVADATLYTVHII